MVNGYFFYLLLLLFKVLSIKGLTRKFKVILYKKEQKNEAFINSYLRIKRGVLKP